MDQLRKYWKGILVRGIIAIIFGLIALFYPAFGLELLVLYFGAFAFVDGLIAFFVGFSSKSAALILEGLVGVLVGLFIFFFTVQAAFFFIMLIGFWAILTGILEIIAAVELRKHMADELWLLLVGIASLLFGFYVFVNPAVSGTIILFVIGIYAIIFGIFLVGLSQTLKNSKSPKKKKRSR